MRSAVVWVCLCWAINANAQEQERKLVDRLLKPDTSLGNSNQNKMFRGGAAQLAHSSSTRAFYVGERRLTKNFVGERQFAATSFPTSNVDAHSATLPATQTAPAFATHTVSDVARPGYAIKVVRAQSYSGNRPFLAQGKSQKALQRKNPPLTIEQVRELLNKDK